MKKFVVAYMSFFDNKLEQKIILAEDWRQALILSNFIEFYTDDMSDIDNASLQEFKKLAFDYDSMIDVIEV